MEELYWEVFPVHKKDSETVTSRNWFRIIKFPEQKTGKHKCTIVPADIIGPSKDVKIEFDDCGKIIGCENFEYQFPLMDSEEKDKVVALGEKIELCFCDVYLKRYVGIE